jgi:hypothetical protein
MMTPIRKTFLGLALAAAGLVAGTVSSGASAFFGWQIADVPAWDTLNVRAYPSSQSQILVAYPNGTMLSLTGVCTNGVNLEAVSGLPGWQQRQAVRYAWCQAWVDPQGSGEYRTAWVYGKYIAPSL